jgi:thiol-disulfide isomerase/thioredoxin
LKVPRRHLDVALALVVSLMSNPLGGVGPATAGEHPAPAFTIRSLDGKSLSSKKLKGRPLVIDFWATWCGPCRHSMPHLDAMYRRYEERGLVVVGLSLDEADPERVRQFAHRLGVTFPIAMANEELLEGFGPIRALPTTYFVDRGGIVKRRVVGYIDEETLDAYVRELVATTTAIR